MKNKITLTDRLVDLRKKVGFNRNELHEKLGITCATIKNWETGRRSPNARLLEKYADYFDVSIDYLMGRTNNPKVNDPIKES